MACAGCEDRGMSADLDQLRANDDAWDEFVARSDTDFPLQMSAWAAAKAPYGWSSARVVAEGEQRIDH